MITQDIYLIMNCPVSPRSMGGGDRIMIEYAKVLSRSGYKVTLLACEEGLAMCQSNDLPGEKLVISRFSVARFGMMGAYLLRILRGLFTSLPIHGSGLVYSASDFLPDTLPAFKVKLSCRATKWVVGFYLRARNPFLGEVPLGRRSLVYFLQQQLSLFLMKMVAVDGILVLSDEDLIYLTSKGFPKSKIFLTSGGIDLTLINRVPEGKILYDVCFVGKFQDQKGLPELVEIWRRILERRPQSKLAVIGWGIDHWVNFLEVEVRRNGWDNSVKLLGFLDGHEKFLVLKKSKVLLFPSTYESWGIVTIEALAAGLPVVAFALPVLKRNIDRGIIFSPLGDIYTMAKNVLDLLEDDELYRAKKAEALDLAQNYDWQIVGQRVLRFLECLN